MKSHFLKAAIPLLFSLLLTFVTTWAVETKSGVEDLKQNFITPPNSARPWVYWFPLSGSLTKEGITADLEAMARVGIGGVLYMEVSEGAPQELADFAGPKWRELFDHACKEAQRLGLEINLNNDAGWTGSGGPWITPELSMQKVVWSEMTLDGGKKIEINLPQPKAVRNFYRDIAVLAMPEASNGVVESNQIVDLTGRSDWEAPPGKWRIIRFGHTTTGQLNQPAPESGRGLECDKFSKQAAAAQFNAFVGTLVDSRKALVSTHIDSWEVGTQNWTPNMREEFRSRRGYDLWKFLPVLAGQTVDSAETTARFMWDFQQTASDLIAENYAGEMRRLANERGLRLSIEAYGGPTDDMTYAGQADEPMAEFWAWGKFGAAFSCIEMSSAAHTYGKRIVGAEAFTSNNEEKWLSHPGNIKDVGDWAFCEGINRFVFHRYAAQPWSNVAPGLSMGPWGLHYERTQTWWEFSKAWHEYLARCQYLLQQGLFVADVVYLQPEGAPRTFSPPASAKIAPLIRGGYNFDGCTPEVVLKRFSVKDGRLVLPDGMSYRVLVLPDSQTMTLPLLRRIKELVDAGATILASPKPPQKSSSLTDNDAEVKQLADELWPRLITGKTAADVLRERGVKPDFTSTPMLRYIHRNIGDTDIYFVANPDSTSVDAMASFRVTGKRPEFWWPDTGRIRKADVFEEKDGVTTMPISFDPNESVLSCSGKVRREWTRSFESPAMANRFVRASRRFGFWKPAMACLEIRSGREMCKRNCKRSSMAARPSSVSEAWPRATIRPAVSRRH